MNKKKIQLHTLTESVFLSPAEKSIMKAEMLRHMRKPSSSFSYRSMIFYMKNHVVAVLLVVIVFSSTTTSVLANKAIPGDVLYAMKTKVNEPIESLFATSEYAKAEWNVILATRRLEEAKMIEEKETVPEHIKKEHRKVLLAQIELADQKTTPFKGDDEEEDQYSGVIAMSARVVSEEAPEEVSLDVALFSAEMATGVAESDSNEDMRAKTLIQNTTQNSKETIQEAIVRIEQKIKEGKERNLPKEKLLRLYARKIKLESELITIVETTRNIKTDSTQEEIEPSSSMIEATTSTPPSSKEEEALDSMEIEGEVEGENEMNDIDHTSDSLPSSKVEPIRSLLRTIR